MDLGNGIIIEAETVFRKMKIAMTWLSEPGRVNNAISVENVVFSTLISRENNSSGLNFSPNLI
jgi:hypothetical protein